MATMPLLSHSESLKFQSALIDFSDGVPAPEWSMYTADFDEHSLPRREGSERLAKATKDLMALDSNPLKWNESADRDIMAAGGTPFDLSFRPLGVPPPHPPPFSGFSLPPSALSRPPAPPSHRPPLSVVPGRTLDSSAASDSQHSMSSVSTDTTPPPPTPPNLKRPYPSSPGRAGSSSSALASATAGASSSACPQAKKHRTTAAPTPPQPPPPAGPILGAKPTLLTPSQKKANHIQSEQKRRANIRRGYEALCDTVPALREAIRAEEEAQGQGQGAEDAAAAAAKGKSKRKGRGKKGGIDTGEKIDGRAGPRSENVVLQKTIDYINDLLSERTALLGRLNRARSGLAPGHPALAPRIDGALPMWERTWTGGSGNLEDAADGGGADSDDEDES
ncbi:hypothetical protein M0805_004915 [Coniferiporia weirii]|nr:hypothetical protein M0805_004915 [Coniferiporia weirii]